MEKMVMYAIIGLAALGGYFLYQKYQLKEKVFNRAAKLAE
jgi:uncharacterized membrane protein YuzA (DUF378 family)